MPRRSWTNLDSILQRGLVNARATLGLANGLHELFSIRLAEAEEDLSIRASGANGELSPEEVESRIAELREWETACDAVDAQHPKVSELQKAAEAANDRWLQLDDQFIAAPAHTLEDIGMKLEFLTVMADMKDGPNAEVSDRMVFSLIGDIERMTDTKILR